MEAWVDRYMWAWSTNDPADIGALFTDDARYYTAPHREPWVGREGIVGGWIGRKDDAGTWKFRYEVLGIDGDTGFVRGWTDYSDGPDYSNLWVIQLADDGRCSEFTEWWMEIEEEPEASASP